MANDLVVQLGAKLDQFQSDLNQAGDMADSAVSRIEQSFANLNPGLGGFASLGTAAAGVTGLIGGLLATLTKVNSELAELQKNAEFTGLTAERFQQIQFAAVFRIRILRLTCRRLPLYWRTPRRTRTL
ncbi:hypothetical protein [Bradyrhizobium sp. CB1015]|uniref:hypothetical protein n=1 Tax=Bradyrhizobium sp. CB1015 TaxID=2976822 RepID=UPI0021A98F52|nr:hypothetical protein [Bradyrhizobium sp. CB1015]UWU89609.1 hypothetical protein N2604_24265 [Bradyrhizobium sp. CB1015]